VAAQLRKGHALRGAVSNKRSRLFELKDLGAKDLKGIFDVVNIAARLQALAEPNAVVMTARVQRRTASPKRCLALACARAATAYVLPPCSTMSQPAATFGRSTMTAVSPDMFAVQHEITEAIAAAVEPQIYAAEGFRARRKPPDSMDASDH
jgi:hypothetical protein